MAVNLSPELNDTQFDSNGNLASGWLIYTYAAGSTTPLATYTDNTGVTLQQNPIPLNARGEVANLIWLTANTGYKLVLKDASNNTIRTFDNVTGITTASAATSEWQLGPAPTYLTASTFSLAGDQRTDFHVGRRLKFTVTAGTVYGKITASAFTTLTTVTVQMDGSQALDSGLTAGAVYYSLLTADVLATPEYSATAAGTDTYTASVGIVRYVIGNEYRIRIPNANATTTPTLNLDGLGAITIVKNGGAVLAGGDMQANGEYTFRYITGNKMQLLNPYQQIPALRGYIDGYQMSAAGGSASISIGTGQCSDSTNALLINLTTAAFTKTTSAWAVGSGNGGKLSAAAIANNTWYHFYAIYRSDTTVVDIGFDTNASTPTLPANYTHYRRIFSWKTDGSAQWVKGAQYGDYFQYDAPTSDVNSNNPGAAAILRTLTTPLGIRVRALCASMESNATTNRDVYWSDPAVTDTAPSSIPFTSNPFSSANNLKENVEIQIWTNTSSQVRYRSSATGASDVTILSVKGYFDLRGEDA